MAETNLKKGIDFIGVSVVYFCYSGGKFLMHQRSKNARDEHGVWDIGAGGLEWEDSVEVTLRKEISEEYGTTIIRSEFLGYRDVFRESQGQKTHWVTLDFLVEVDASQVKNGEPHKFDAIGWYDFVSPLPENLHSQMPVFLEKYKVRLEQALQKS